jgi:hypothetical protein
MESIMNFTPDKVIQKLFQQLVALVVTQTDGVLDTAKFQARGKNLKLVHEEPDDLPPEEKEEFWNPKRNSKYWDPNWIEGC